MENEYPKMLYKGEQTRIVTGKPGEDAAAKVGWVTHDKRQLPDDPEPAE